MMDALTMIAVCESLKEAFERVTYSAGTMRAEPHGQRLHVLGAELDMVARTIRHAYEELETTARGELERIDSDS